MSLVRVQAGELKGLWFFQIENAKQTSEVKSLESPNPFGVFLRTGRIRFGIFSYSLPSNAVKIASSVWRW